ncbi:MAG: GHMP family kinase ATP-binding protein [Thermoguttaceae bacterium]
MIISRTPLRISFMGGGSDLPAFYEKEPGCVISTAINKYIYVTVNKKFDRHIRASYSITEIVERLGDLQHELIRESMRMTGLEEGIEITSISDIPSSGTGMGSSSSYTVGLLNALHAYRGLHAGAERLAKEACRIEIDICRKPIGKQDQYIAAFGGLQCIRFNPDGSVWVDPIVCKPETKAELQRRMLLLYTGITRSANTILETQKQNTLNDSKVCSALRTMSQMAQAMHGALCANALDNFGEMLDEGWRLKKTIANSISNNQIDDWYERAKKHGALGGKLLGAGGGGFLLLYAHPEDHPQIISALSALTPVPFSFDPQGSKIIYVEENV